MDLLLCDASQPINQDWLVFLHALTWLLDQRKIAHLQYIFSKESSKINDSHMVPLKKPFYFKEFRK